ncbi:MAG: DUF4835 family protein [Ignavibacteriales bacterium]|nr:DUF4835 family protein [Ignavibacteriales bacterium]
MKNCIVFLFAVCLASSLGIGQELQCDVKVNTENITSAQRDFLRNFESDLERYLNNTRFTSEDLDGEKIQCSMDIFFRTVVGENRYQAQVFVGSQRPIYVGNDPSDKVTPILRILDDRWEFTYVPNQRMIQDDFTFDPLTDLLDFYAYLIIGFDLETYTEYSGSRYFQKALQIWTQANGAGAKDWPQSSAGYSRFGFVDELNSTKFQPVITAFHTYHFEGIDLLATDPAKGLEKMLSAIESIYLVRQRQNQTSVFVKQFFDAKYMEIAEAFMQHPDRSVYDRLIAADPEHRSAYDDSRSRNQ